MRALVTFVAVVAANGCVLDLFTGADPCTADTDCDATACIDGFCATSGESGEGEGAAEGEGAEGEGEGEGAEGEGDGAEGEGEGAEGEGEGAEGEGAEGEGEGAAEGEGAEGEGAEGEGVAGEGEGEGAVYLVDSLSADDSDDVLDGRCETASGLCSLRAAIDEVRAGNDADIVFPSSAVASTSSPYNVDGFSVRIRGDTSAHGVITGQDTTALFVVTSGSITIDGVDVTNGDTSGDGGAFNLNDSTLSAKHCALTDNHADGDGGAVFATGTSAVDIEDCLMRDNSAGLHGGALTTAFQATSVSVVLVRDTFDGNSTGRFGGAISLQAALDVTIGEDTFVGNTSADSGGVFDISADCSPDTLNVTNSTFDGNTAVLGGAIATFCSDHTVRFTHCTFTANSPELIGFVDAEGDCGTAFFANCLIVEGAGATPLCTPCGTGQSGGGNVFQGDDATCTLDGTDDFRSPESSFELMGPLAQNGGATPTHFLRNGSDAIDAASAPCTPSHDQRGLTRPSTRGSGDCDAGAFERQLADP